MKKMILSIVSVIMALTTFSQNFSKAYFTTNIDRLFTSQVLTNSDNEIIFSHYNNCDTQLVCSGISKIVNPENSENFVNILHKRMHKNTMKIRNDTLFYSYYDQTPSNNKFYWYYGMTDKSGKLVVSQKYEIPIPYEPFTYLYGLNLVNNNEIILWGNGYDPKVPYQKNDIKMVWIRLSLDGKLISGPNYFKPQLPEWAIVTDAATDIDGNLVYVYEYAEKSVALHKYIFKINEQDEVLQIAKIKAEDNNGTDYSQLAIDSEGNYYINLFDHHLKGVLCPPPILTKINRKGEVVWQFSFDVTRSDIYYKDQSNQDHFYIGDLKTTKNGDILMTGVNTVFDSIYVKSINKKVLVSGWSGSFIARFSKDGKLLWRHLLIATKDNGLERLISIGNIEESSDGSIVVGGAIGTKDSTSNMYYPWVMRVGANGCFDSECSHVNKWWFFPDEFYTKNNILITDDKLECFPNPTNSILNINLNTEAKLPIQYIITSLDGKEIVAGFQNEKSFKLNLNALPSSMYRIVCKDNTGKIWQNIIIKN